MHGPERVAALVVALVAVVLVVVLGLVLALVLSLVVVLRVWPPVAPCVPSRWRPWQHLQRPVALPHLQVQVQVQVQVLEMQVQMQVQVQALVPQGSPRPPASRTRCSRHVVPPAGQGAGGTASLVLAVLVLEAVRVQLQVEVLLQGTCAAYLPRLLPPQQPRRRLPSRL